MSGSSPAPRQFTTVTAVAAPLLRANVDTDAIIPSREIKSVSQHGLADGLFAGWRYRLSDGPGEPGLRKPNPDFILNREAYRTAGILLSGPNFGCGSSREHAVWALREYGIRAVVAPSFAPIFFGNCVRNGVLAATLDEQAIARLATAIDADPQGRPLTIDLFLKRISIGHDMCVEFTIDADSRATLLSGLDPIDVTLQSRAAIESYIAVDRRRRPWVYLESTS